MFTFVCRDFGDLNTKTHKQLILNKVFTWNIGCYLNYSVHMWKKQLSLNLNRFSPLRLYKRALFISIIYVYSSVFPALKPLSSFLHSNLLPFSSSFISLSLFSSILCTSTLPPAIPSSSLSFPPPPFSIVSSSILYHSIKAQDKLKCLKLNSVSSVIFLNWMNSYSAKGHYIQGAWLTVINHILLHIAHYIIRIDFNPVASSENPRIRYNVSSPW